MANIIKMIIIIMMEGLESNAILSNEETEFF